MDRRKCILAIVLICFTGISFIVVATPLVLSIPLKWDAKIGDEISYSIDVDGWILNFTGNGSQIVPSPMMIFDKANITSRITNLPEIGYYLNGEDFRQRVVWISKVETTYLNGSSIPWELDNEVTSMISTCLLPIGSWGIIDWFYPDTASGFPYPPEYISSMGTTSFHFGYDRFDIDLRKNLRSDISYETGIAERISCYRQHGVDSMWNITLTQIGN